MNIFILFLFSPVICSQYNKKSVNLNDEPFLPIHPIYPYNPKLIKRGIEYRQEQQPQSIMQLNPEFYVSKIDSRDSYSTGYGQNSYYPLYNPHIKPVSMPNTFTASSYYQTPYANNLNSYNHLNAYSTPYNSFTTTYGSNGQSFDITPYNNMGVYPNYYHQPYYYPNYYNLPSYMPPPSGYLNRHLKHKNDNNNEDNDDYYELRQKDKKSGNKKNKLKNVDRESDNQYVDGINYVINNSKDLDGESSTHKIPNRYNQIEQNSDIQIRTTTLPQTSYRLVSISGHQPSGDYNSASNGYIKVQQLEQLMRQALTKLLTQNAIQQENLVRIQQENNKQQNDKVNQHYISLPNGIAKTGLSYVVNPMILNRVTPVKSSKSVNSYVPNELFQTQAILDGNQSYEPKSATSITFQQSPGIYIPPRKINSDHSTSLEYGDYDSSESVTIKNQKNIESFQATVEPTHKSYLYSTYRPTQQTNLDDVNFGNKQKISDKG